MKVKYYGSATGTVNFTVKRAYTITYHANGGISAPATQTKLYDDTLTLTTGTPTRSNYNFVGWATNRSAINASYQPGSNFTDNADTTLYAVWTPKNCVLTYDANGGLGAPSPQNSPYHELLTISSTIPTRFGYTFLGWSTGSGDTSATCFPGGSLTLGGDTTLYAIWKSASTIDSYVSNRDYDVTIPFANGCAFYVFTPSPKRFQFESYGDGDTQIYLYDANGTLLARDDDSGDNLNFLLNYDFVSGNTYYVKVQYYASGSGNFTFNLARAYDITYNANGGTDAPAAQVKTHAVSINLSSEVPSRSGYDFLGWSIQSGATSASYQPGDSYTANNNLSLYAVWASNCDNGHSYSYKAIKAPTTSATGTLTGTCSKCSGTTTVTLPKLNTTDYSYSVTKAATCAATGTGRYNWKTTTYGSFYFDVSIAATGHSYSYKATKAPTTSATGILTGTCSKCSGTTTVTLPKLNTTDYTYTVTKAATCTAAGTGRYTWKTTTYGSFYFDVSIAATGHSYSYKATKAPTTSATGTLTGTCSKCSGTTTVTLPKLNTTDYSYGVTKAATCTATGTGRYTWKTTTYGSFYFDVSIAAKGHTYTSKVTAPTCTQQGYTTHTCTCGDSFVDSYVNALGHDMGAWTVVTAVTCTKAGTERRDCSRCDHYETRVISATGHSYEPHVTAPTCTEVGYTQYICTACGSSYTGDYTDATGHDHKAAVTSPTCTRQGFTTYTCHCGDSYVSDYTNALGHDMRDWVTATEATCTEAGQQIRECSRCDHRETRAVDVLGHDWDDGVVTIEPTEVLEGEMTYTCERCSLTRTETIPTLDHKHRYDAIVTAPTCTEKGYTTHTCSCGHSYVDTYLDALGQDMGQWSTVSAATCIETGLELRGCSRCDYCETREIATTGHSFTTYVSDGNATCTLDGTRTAVCDRCDATDTTADPGSARGHDFSEWSVVEEPTATTDGLEYRFCYSCGLEETRVIARLDNPFTDVPMGSFYYEPVLWAVANGITNGTSATTFSPNDQCLRAHVVTFLHRAVGSPAPVSDCNPFTDVKTSDFFYKPVLWAVENGITNGLDTTAFGSYTVCNRAAVVTFLWRAAGSPEPISTSHPFTDVDRTDFFYKPVLWAVENGITNGIDVSHFGPTVPCNRAQVVTFLYRAFAND